MFYARGEDYNGNCYEFPSISRTIEEVKKECQELLETLDGGLFDIFVVIDGKDVYVDTVEW